MINEKRVKYSSSPKILFTSYFCNTLNSVQYSFWELTLIKLTKKKNDGKEKDIQEMSNTSNLALLEIYNVVI